MTETDEDGPLGMAGELLLELAERLPALGVVADRSDILAGRYWPAWAADVHRSGWALCDVLDGYPEPPPVGFFDAPYPEIAATIAYAFCQDVRNARTTEVSVECMVEAARWAERGRSEQIKAAISDRARASVDAKHANGKQAQAMRVVKTYWKSWKAEPALYRNVRAFVLAQLDRLTRDAPRGKTPILRDYETMREHVLGWEKQRADEAKTGSTRRSHDRTKTRR